MPIQGRLKKFAGVGIRHKGSWSGGTRLHSPTKSGRKLFGTKRYDTTILPWSRTGIGGHRTSKHGFILQGPHKTYSSVEKKLQEDGFVRDSFLSHLHEPQVGAMSLGGKALILLGLLSPLSIGNTDHVSCAGKSRNKKNNAPQEVKRGKKMANFLSGVNAVGESLTNLVNNITGEAVESGNDGTYGHTVSTPKKKSTAKRESENINATPSPVQKAVTLNSKKDAREADYILDRKSLPGVGADKDGAQRSSARQRTEIHHTPVAKDFKDEESVISPPRTARVTSKGEHLAKRGGETQEGTRLNFNQTADGEDVHRQLSDESGQETQGQNYSGMPNKSEPYAMPPEATMTARASTTANTRDTVAAHDGPASRTRQKARDKEKNDCNEADMNQKSDGQIQGSHGEQVDNEQDQEREGQI